MQFAMSEAPEHIKERKYLMLQALGPESIYINQVKFNFLN